MKYSQVIRLFNQTKLSPEKLAPYFEIGSMTIRRWYKSPEKTIAPSYQTLIAEGIKKLIRDGFLSSHSKDCQELLRFQTQTSFEVSLQELGIQKDLFHSLNSKDPSNIFSILSSIGHAEDHQNKVRKNSSFIEKFRKKSKEWKEPISKLTDIVHSKNMLSFDKTIAFGALFSLITPFDLIPDYLPALGLVDDFGILTFAVSFYSSHFQDSDDQSQA